MPSRRLVLAGSLAAALTIRYLLPHPEADAAEQVAALTPKRDPQVLREVLVAARRVEPVEEIGETDDERDDAGEDEEDNSQESPRLAVNDAGEPLDVDGLTETERFESEVAVIEDRLQPSVGALAGVIKDEATGEPLAGVTVVATSPALQGVQAAITDERGFYTITELPPGEYMTTFYYAEVTIERSGLVVADRKTTPSFAKIATRPYNGPVIVQLDDVIEVNDVAPVIDPTSTVQGITIDTDCIKNIPVGRTFEAALGAAADSQGDPTGEVDDVVTVSGDNYMVNIPVGRTFESALGTASGSQTDGLGISFTGTTSVENTYYVDAEPDSDVID